MQNNMKDQHGPARTGIAMSDIPATPDAPVRRIAFTTPKLTHHGQLTSITTGSITQGMWGG